MTELEELKKNRSEAFKKYKRALREAYQLRKQFKTIDGNYNSLKKEFKTECKNGEANYSSKFELLF